MVIDAGAGKVSMRLGADPTAAATIAGSPPQILALFSGSIALRDAARKGIRIAGSRKAVQRILPRSTQ